MDQGHESANKSADRAGCVSRIQRKIHLLRCLSLGDARKSPQGMPLYLYALGIFSEVSVLSVSDKELGVDMQEIRDIYCKQVIHEVQVALLPFEAEKPGTEVERTVLQTLCPLLTELSRMKLSEYLEPQVRELCRRLSSLT